MITTRRAALALLATPALAQSRPIRLVAPYAPGGVTDQLARAWAEILARELGQPVVVENRPGANTIIGTEAVSRAAPDGLTLLMASGASMVLNPLLYRRLPYDAERDLVTLGMLVETPLLMVAPPALGVASAREFAELARRRALNSASVGVGNPIHLAAELFRAAAGIELQNVVYPGSAPALAALLSGDVQVMFDVVLTALPFVRDGRLRALAVTTRERLAVLPDVPTVAETYPGYEATTWFGLAAPRGLPAETETRLRGAIAVVQADAGLRSRFGALGLIMLPARDAPAIAATLASERARWGDIIRARGITLEQ